jgi:hypothetical protein
MKGCKGWNFKIKPVELKYVTSKFQIPNVATTAKDFKILKNEISSASRCPPRQVTFEYIESKMLPPAPTGQGFFSIMTNIKLLVKRFFFLIFF